MNAKTEIQQWLERHRQLASEAAKEQFFKKLAETLEQKASDGLHESLTAFWDSVRSTPSRAEKSAKNKSVRSLQVFPKNRAEQELLEQLLERMAIPFKMSS